jgi:predicted ArsR family transcriptional regulator
MHLMFRTGCRIRDNLPAWPGERTLNRGHLDEYNEFGRQLAGLSALDDRLRRRLYALVVARGELSRDQAARAAKVSRALAAFHLDRLVEVGLIEATFRRLKGRGGPGAGRPSKLYRRAARQFGVSLPPRGYELAARVLAGALGATGSPAAAETLRLAARQHGRALAPHTPAGGGAPLRRAARALESLGYEPGPDAAGGIVLRNCPFESLRAGCSGVVCGMNHALIEGLLEAGGLGQVEARLEPDPGRCCVVLRARRGG